MKILLLAALLPFTALAGTPAELPNTAGIDAPNMSQEQLVLAAQRCIKTTLKNEQFTVSNNSTASFLTGTASAKAAAPTTTADPTALIDTQAEAGRIEGRHTFATSGMMTQGIIRSDVLIETKPNKFRITWHDPVYTAPVEFHWEKQLQPLIKEALPYKKAIAELQATTEKLSQCMTTPAVVDSDW